MYDCYENAGECARVKDHCAEHIPDILSERAMDCAVEQAIERPIGRDFNEGVCIHTGQVYDAVREKDCLEDMRCYFSARAQQIIDNAASVKIKKAEIIWVYTDIEPIHFNRGFFSVDMRYFFRITLEACACSSRPCEVEGLCVFDKKVVLFGSEGNSKTFSSKYDPDCSVSRVWEKNNMPKAVVDVVEPVALSAKLVEKCNCCRRDRCCDVPEAIRGIFDEDLIFGETEKAVFVSLGLFTIVRIERDVQLLIPAIDFCIPTREYMAEPEPDNSPCKLFSTIRFPIDDFFPPQKRELARECRG